jgi:hypothetical protein
LKREVLPLETDGDWSALAAAIAGGLGHELNGRVTSLLGIAHVARLRGVLEAGLLDDLEEEVQRLKRATVLLRRLPFFASTGLRLDRVADVVRDAIQLNGLGGHSDVILQSDGDGDSPPILLASPILAKALLLLFAASRQSRPAAVREVRVLDAADQTHFVLIEAAGGDTADQPINAVRSLGQGRQLIESMGGGVVVEESTAVTGGHRITITLPAAVPPIPPAER